MNEEKRKKRKKRESGVSIITLVITIIVIIILAIVSFGGGFKSIGKAGETAFIQELKEVEENVARVRLDNQLLGTEEEEKNKGFYKSYVQNPPENFQSFSKNYLYGYVVNLNTVDETKAKRGKDFENFSGDPENNMVVFGEDDVYVYDARGVVYYAKGYEGEDAILYTLYDKDGPQIISVQKNVSSDRKSVTLRIAVKPNHDGQLSVTVDKASAEKKDTLAGNTYFEKEVFENKTYNIMATEQGYGSTQNTVSVTEIEANTFTVTYDANGGENAPEIQIKTENVSLKLSTETPTREGYTFMGWSTSQDSLIVQYRPGGEFITDENTVLYAVWQQGVPREWTLTYNANGGKGEPASVKAMGEVVISGTVPTREGYGFDGWSEDPKALEGMYKANDRITLLKNTNLYAIWIKDAYTLTLTSSPEGAGVLSGGGAKVEGTNVVITANANPGYAFQNWRVKKGNINLTNSALASTMLRMPANAVEVVANFESIGMEVRYNGNGGVGVPAPEVVDYGTIITITSMIPTRIGYDFLGWSLMPNANIPTYAAGNSYEISNNVVFYAVWQKHVNTYTLSYDKNVPASEVSFVSGDFTEQEKIEKVPVQIHPQAPTRLDFTYYGWTLEAKSEDVVYRPGEMYEKDRDTTLYAIWKDEMPPRDLAIIPSQEEDDLFLTGIAHDEGLIDAYAWVRPGEPDEPQWQTDDNTGGKDIRVTIKVNEKGTYHIFFKDKAGNISNTSIEVYQVTYNSNGGREADTYQFKAHGTSINLTRTKRTRQDYTFLGWSTSATPLDDESSVTYASGAEYVTDSDVTLKAVWGPTWFTLNKETGITQIDGNNLEFIVTKSKYTGNITVSSEDEEVAKAVIIGNKITVSPQTKIGTILITVTEDREGSQKVITITVNKGIRALTINDTSLTFTYGDASKIVSFSYRGKDVAERVDSSNTNVAIASVSGKQITVTPRNVGSATITLTLPEDDQYVTRTGEISVTVNEKDLIVTPRSGYTKVWDGTDSTVTIEFDYSETAYNEVPRFTGRLTIDGSDAGNRVITLGTLALADNGSFRKSNYRLRLSSTTVYFTITKKPMAFPTTNTRQGYTSNTLYVAAEGDYYIRSGQYGEIMPAVYTATISLIDSRNHMWSDTGTSDNRNVEWEIYCTHVWVDATCTEDEYCSICGMTRNPALGHDFIDHSDLTSEYFYCGATCITKETYYQKCSRCGARGTNTFTVGDYGNHYWQYTGSSPATCTSSGYTSYTCAYCGDNDYDTIPATGHDTYVTTRAATCTVGGASTTRCHNCGWQSTTTTSALGHDWETATINGITTSKCRRCGATRGSGHT